MELAVQSKEIKPGLYNVDFIIPVTQINNELGPNRDVTVQLLESVMKRLNEWNERQDEKVPFGMKKERNGDYVISFANVTKEQQEYLKQINCLFLIVDDKKELIFAIYIVVPE